MLPWLSKLKTPAGALAAFLLALAVVLAVGLGDSDEPPEPASVPLPEVAGTYVDPKLGVTVGFPEGWKARREQGAVEVRRRDDAGLVTIASPAPAKESAGVLKSAVQETSGAYRQVERLGSEKLTLGGHRAETRTMLGTNDEGTRLRILLAGVRGERRTYLVSAFFPQEQDLRLLEIERVLNSLRFEK